VIMALYGCKRHDHAKICCERHDHAAGRGPARYADARIRSLAR